MDSQKLAGADIFPIGPPFAFLEVRSSWSIVVSFGPMSSKLKSQKSIEKEDSKKGKEIKESKKDKAKAKQEDEENGRKGQERKAHQHCGDDEPL